MKKISTFLYLLLLYSFCDAQNSGSITSKKETPKAGILNGYIYNPPKNLLIPDKIRAIVVYLNKGTFYSKSIPVSRVDNNYLFSFKAPDSTAVLIFSLADGSKEIIQSSSLVVPKKKIVDNNNEDGFVVFLNNGKGRRFDFETIMLARLRNSFARYALELKPVSTKTIIKMFEDAYRLYPELKKEESYLDYLTVLYKEKYDAVKPKLLFYAKQMILVQNDETKWMRAKRIYQLLKMDKEQQIIEGEILSAYPNGQEAEQRFWDRLYNQKDRTEASTLASMDEYISRFKDSSNNVKDRFYNIIVSLLLDKKEWNKLMAYECLIHNKLLIPYIYNRFAWGLSGKQIDTQGSDLEIAKMLSKKSLDYIEELMKDSSANDDYEEDLTAVHNMLLNTYSLILYKLGEYDTAFYYQDEIFKRGGELDAGGLERYAVYAQKVKGVIYTKQVIEQQLLEGLNSPILIKQLQSIYKQLQLPENEFGILKEKANLLAKLKMSESIKAKFGVTKANDFNLKNLQGQNISLSSYKNKIVIIDFWASRCVPCRASFPAMQELVNNYKQDSSVVFLFIDVWENKSPEKMQEMAQKIMTDGNYNFNVLLDTKDKVVDNFRIDAIPAKFIIDKKGEIVFMGETTNIALEIEKARN